MLHKTTALRKNKGMKHILLLAFTLFSLPLAASVPVSATIGRVAVEIPSGSITETALKAAESEYTEAWLDEYALDKISFGEAYSELLSSLLPLSDLIAGEERNNAVTLKSLADGTVLSFVFRDGKIAALTPVP